MNIHIIMIFQISIYLFICMYPYTSINIHIDIYISIFLGVQVAVGSAMMQINLVALIMTAALLKIHTELEGKYHLSFHFLRNLHILI